MKKLLLNYKSLNYAVLLFLLCANSIYSQTILTETFGIAGNAAYTGGTSVPSLSYTQSGGGVASTAVIGTGTDAYLNLITNATGTAVGTRPTLSGTLPTVNGFNPKLTENNNLVTWTVNMKANQLGSNSNTSYTLGKKFVCVVLCASNAGILGNTTPTASDGYALMYQKYTADATKASISLIKFHNGIGDDAVPPTTGAESCVITRLIESPALTTVPATATYAALSVKVVYDPRNDSWELYYREDDAAAAFVNPTTGILLPANTGIVTDTTYTSTTMTNFGFISGAQTNNNVKSQFDNFKITLSTLPPLPPTVEKRQVFNNTSTTPKVSDLSPQSTSGITINWYDAFAGNPLTQNTSLTYRNYYVSQTISGAESAKVLSQVFVGDTGLKSLPLYENFNNFTLGDKLIVINNNPDNGTGLGSWSVSPQIGGLSADDITIATAPAWTNTTLPPFTAGNAITFVAAGVDPELKFTDTTSGSLYSSFLCTIADTANLVTAAVALAPAPVPAGIDAAKSNPTGIYSFLSQSSTGTERYTADVMFRKNFTTNKFNIGLSKSDNNEECTWSSTEYDFGTQYLIMISYENIGDPNDLNQVANLWINPTTTILPIPTPTLTQNSPTTPVSRNNIDRIKILQAASKSTPTLIIDEIRVADNWGQALGAAATLAITSVTNTGFKVYPNPVSNGKLYISSSTNLEKEVLIFNTIGQRVLQTKTVTEEAINVSNLNKGTYFVKITEAGITATKKLIIQ